MKAHYWICALIASWTCGFMVGFGNHPFKYEERKTNISWHPAWQIVYGEEMNKGDTCIALQNDCWQTVLRNVMRHQEGQR